MKKRFLSLALVLALTLAFVPTATANFDSASDWARDGLTAAIEKGFVQPDLQSNYQSTITRAEFCYLAVGWVWYYSEKNAYRLMEEKGLTYDPNAFTDTDDPIILLAYALGITSGVGGGLFNPNGTFTREQAAGMILNVGKVIGLDTSNIPQSGFTDIGDVSEWCVDGVNFVKAYGIMQGDNNKFDPKRAYTREQSILTFGNIGRDIKKEEVQITKPDNNSDDVQPTSIRFSGGHTGMNVKLGGDSRIDVVLEPKSTTNKTLTWNSSDPTVATVSDTGRVYGIAPGRVMITVTTANGLTLQKRVTVPIPPDEIDIEKYNDYVRQEFYVLINEYRRSNGLRELQVNLALQDYADMRAEEQKITGGHTRPDGSSAGSGWHNSSNIMNTRYAENCGPAPWIVFDLQIAAKEHAEDIFNRWKNSPGHNRHMLYNFKQETTMALGLYLRPDYYNTGFGGFAVWASGY